MATVKTETSVGSQEEAIEQVPGEVGERLGLKGTDRKAFLE